MATKGYRSYEVNLNSTKKSGFTDKSKLKCLNYGGTRHTREDCFELIGYPDWWKDPRKKKQGDNSRGRASLEVSREPQQTGAKETYNLSFVDSRCVAATTQVRRDQIDHAQAPDSAQTYRAPGTDQGEQGKGKSCTKCMINNSSKNMNWVIDSGATDHMTYEDGEFREIRKPHKNRYY
ncbi:uncharacterized protein A4U43_C05F10150 [Asparagus officinalis]|uniref:Gag-pol polyprotein n=1 Tax=Asparagus officinalis TaxID=4686 RepID=A0A5P1EUZ6_ASPOF|nr:uncharacterized protein A4U43_C05F10150 [Asparagus officinalis]